MEMSGIDYLIPITPGLPVTDVILRVCRNYWPNCVVRGAEEDHDRPITDPSLWSIGPDFDEFFVYRDSNSALDWHRHGSTERNADAMVHFMVDGGDEFNAPSVVAEYHDLSSRSVLELLEALDEEFFDLHSLPKRWALAEEEK